MPSNAVIAARRPLIVDHQVPLDWIETLSESRLGMLLSAILLAKQAGMDWRKEWLDAGIKASDVVDEHLPELERKSVKLNGRAATRAIAGELRHVLPTDSSVSA